MPSSLRWPVLWLACSLALLPHSTHGLLMGPSLLDQVLQLVWDPSALVRVWVGLDQLLNVARSWGGAARKVATLPFREGRDGHIKIQEPRKAFGRMASGSHLDRFARTYSNEVHHDESAVMKMGKFVGQKSVVGQRSLVGQEPSHELRSPKHHGIAQQGGYKLIRGNRVGMDSSVNQYHFLNNFNKELLLLANSYPDFVHRPQDFLGGNSLISSNLVGKESTAKITRTYPNAVPYSNPFGLDVDSLMTNIELGTLKPGLNSKDELIPLYDAANFNDNNRNLFTFNGANALTNKNIAPGLEFFHPTRSYMESRVKTFKAVNPTFFKTFPINSIPDEKQNPFASVNKVLLKHQLDHLKEQEIMWHQNLQRIIQKDKTAGPFEASAQARLQMLLKVLKDLGSINLRQLDSLESAKLNKA